MDEIKTISSFRDFVNVSQCLDNCKEKLQCNMTTILMLKKIRGYEAEYFTAYNKSGAAFTCFQKLLENPPSATWGLLGNELIGFIHYWLDVVRQKLSHSNFNWSSFLKILLHFITEISNKDPSLKDMLVRETTDSLLGLATNSHLDAEKKMLVLQTFNLFCSKSSREVRHDMREQLADKLEEYFIQLSSIMATCGHLPLQHSILETLMRWLLWRQDPVVKLDTTKRWFPESLYGRDTVELFLERQWKNFLQDARDFLNSHNQRGDQITTVVCKKLVVGYTKVLTLDETKNVNFVDINTANRSISVLVEPRTLHALGCKDVTSWAALQLPYCDVSSVILCRKSIQVTITVTTKSMPNLSIPLNLFEDKATQIEITISSHKEDVVRVDNALKTLFQEKYQLLLDFDNLPLSSRESEDKCRKQFSESEEESRFSHNFERKRVKCSGGGEQILRRSLKSPSSISTSSLVQLRDKLDALPAFKFNREKIRVTADPALSVVTEISEIDSVNTHNTFRRWTGIQTGRRHQISQSDTEVSKRGEKIFKRSRRTEQSCLLAATIPEVDDALLNELSQSLPGNTSIVDLVVNEALCARNNNNVEVLKDSGINLQDNSVVIEDTPKNILKTRKDVLKTAKNKSSTTDESTTDVVEDTPCFVTTRKPKTKLLGEIQEKEVFDQSLVDNFFAQHYRENEKGDTIVSPSLAKKLNDSSYESNDSDDEFIVKADKYIIDNNLQHKTSFDVDKSDILECMNYIVDQVCDEIKNCTEGLQLESDIDKSNNIADKDKCPQNIELKFYANQGNKKKRPMRPKKGKSKQSKNIKKKGYTKDNETVQRPQDKFENVCVDKRILRTPVNPKRALTTTESETDTSMKRRRRKLYSPKDEDVLLHIAEKPTICIPETEDSNTVQSASRSEKNVKCSSSMYKDIEVERKNHYKKKILRKPKLDTPVLSPRSIKKNEEFDRLKDTIDSNEPLIYAQKSTKDGDIYNFTSDSEDEDFKAKKNVVKKHRSSITITSTEAFKTKHGRNVRKLNYNKIALLDSSDAEVKKVSNFKKKKTPKSNTRILKSTVDEQMRKNITPILDTSIVHEVPKIYEIIEEPVLIEPPEMVLIEEKGDKLDDSRCKIKTSQSKIKSEKGTSKSLSLKKLKVFIDNESTIEIKEKPNDDSGESLPGLVIEKTHFENAEKDSVTADVAERILKICVEGPADEPSNEALNNTQTMLLDNDVINQENSTDAEIRMIEQIIEKESNKLHNEHVENDNKNSCVKNNINNYSKTSLNQNNVDQKDQSLIAESPKLIEEQEKSSKNCSKNKISPILISEDSEQEVTQETLQINGSINTPQLHLDKRAPSPNSIDAEIEGRELDIQNLDEPLKIFRRQVLKRIFDQSDSEASFASSKSVSNDAENKPNNNKRKYSLVPVLQRLSSAEICMSPKEDRRSKQNKNNKEIEDIIDTSINSKETQKKILLPKVSLEKLSSEDLDQWLGRSFKKNNGGNKNEKNKRPKRLTGTLTRKRSVEETKKDLNRNSKRVSVISPINLDLLCQPVATLTRFDEVYSESSQTTLHFHKDILKRTLSNQKPNEKLQRSTETEDSEEQSQKYTRASTSREKTKTHKNPTVKKRTLSPLRSSVKRDKYKIMHYTGFKSAPSIDTEEESQKYTRASTSREKAETLKNPTVKKRTLSHLSSSVKSNKYKVVDYTGIESAPSIASVDDWMVRNASLKKTGGTKSKNPEIFRTIIENLIEKVDATLTEMNNTTNENNLRLIVSVQEKLNENRNRTIAMYSEALAALEEKSKKMDEQVLNYIKQLSTEVILKDVKNRKALTDDLNEDLQAVKNLIDKD